MRSVRIVLASAFLVVMLSSASGQQTSNNRAAEEAAIRAADAAVLKAAQVKDVAGATANYADDAFWLPPHAPLVQGKEAIRNAWAQFLSIPGLKIDWQITKVDVSQAGDMAYTLQVRHDHGRSKRRAHYRSRQRHVGMEKTIRRHMEDGSRHFQFGRASPLGREQVRIGRRDSSRL